MKTSRLTLGHHRSYDSPDDPATKLLAGVLRAFLFWNTNWLSKFRAEDGLFAWHSGKSDAEEFCRRMEAIGVLVRAGRRGYRLTIRYDAIDAYSSFLVDAGLEVDDIVGAFAVLIVDGPLELLPTGTEPFAAKYYDHEDGTTSFDTRNMLNCLVELGYAIRLEEKFAWTDRMQAVLRNLPWVTPRAPRRPWARMRQRGKSGETS